MEIKLNILHEVELSKKDMIEVTFEYLKHLYGITDNMRLDDDGWISVYSPSNHCGASGNWETLRSATEKDKEYFSIAGKIFKDKQ